MADQGSETRLVVECDDCEAVFAAVETSDGRALPIGSKGGCDCGCTDFTRISSGELLPDDGSDEVAGEG